MCARHAEQLTRVSEGTRCQALPGAAALVGPSGPWAATPDGDAAARRRAALGPDAGCRSGVCTHLFNTVSEQTLLIFGGKLPN